MGAFYTSIALRGPSQSRVREVLSKLRRTAYVSPTRKGITFVYDRKCEGQDTKDICEVALALSRELECAAWGVLNHDDDVLWYVLCDVGDYADHYNSAPNYFDDDAEPAPPEGGDAAVLCSAFRRTNARAKVAAILRKPQDEYVFASERHRDLAKALGVPAGAAAIGYSTLEEGEAPVGVSASGFVHVTVR